MNIRVSPLPARAFAKNSTSSPHWASAVLLALLSALPTQSSAADPTGTGDPFKGKSATCIQRFKKSNADFCRVEADERNALVSGTETKIPHKEVVDILFVMNEVAYACKFEPLDMKMCPKAAAPEFGGIGFAFQKQTDETAGLQILDVQDGGPASLAGVHTGDLVVKIDDRTTSAMTADEARRALRGAPGSTVQLEIVGAQDAERKVVKIRRAVIRLAR